MITTRDAQVEDTRELVLAEKAISTTPGLLASRSHELNDSSFRQKISDLRVKYIVAIENKKIVGHAFLDPMGLEAVEHIYRLTIAVHPGHEQKGVGTVLMTSLIDWAKETKAVEKIELNVRASNERAIKLYEKLGFHQEGRLQKRIKLPDGNYVDDLVMGLFTSPT